MAYQAPKDYVEVKHRVIEFRAKHPDGSLQAGPVEWVRDEQNRIIGLTIQAKAYRSPDDPRPGVGTAFEFYPGKTPYTKGSEVQNAETSAWGRALIALGAADATHGIASADEVRRSSQGNSGNGSPAGRSAASKPPSKRDELAALLASKKVDPDLFKEKCGTIGAEGLSDLSDGGVGVMVTWVNSL